MNNFFLPLKLAFGFLRNARRGSAAFSIAVTAIIGVAVATAATVCVLSVFNGFNKVLTRNVARISPDIEITPRAGKVIGDSRAVMERIMMTKGVKSGFEVLDDQSLALYQGRELPVTLRGVDFHSLRANTDLDSLLLAGSVPATDRREVLLSVGAASQLGVYNDADALLLFSPRPQGRINTVNPLASFVTDSVYMSGVFESRQNELDENTIFCDISVARKIFERQNGSSSIWVFVDKGAEKSVLDNLKEEFGAKYYVKDRLQQTEINFRMVKIEKWVTFLLLVFILIIASFNVISTLSMIVIEKKRMINSLHGLGLAKSKIGGVFFWESVLITLSGGILGITLGGILCLLQQKIGIIRLSGDPDRLLTQYYPVELLPIDILAVIIPVVLIGVFTGWIAASFARGRVNMS